MAEIELVNYAHLHGSTVNQNKGKRGVGEMIQPYWSKKVIPRLLHHLQLKVTTDALNL